MDAMSVEYVTAMLDAALDYARDGDTDRARLAIVEVRTFIENTQP